MVAKRFREDGDHRQQPVVGIGEAPFHLVEYGPRYLEGAGLDGGDMVELDQFMTCAVDKFDREMGVLAQERVQEAVDGSDKSGAAFELVHVVGLDDGAATCAVDGVFKGWVVADDAIWGGGFDGGGWLFGRFDGHGYLLIACLGYLYWAVARLF